MKVGDIIAFAKINKPYSYGKVLKIISYDIRATQLQIMVLYEDPECKYPYLINVHSDFSNSEIIKKIDSVVISNENKIKEIMHLYNKMQVFAN